MSRYWHPHYYLLKDIVYFPGFVNHIELYWICSHHAHKVLLLNTTGTRTLQSLLTHAEVHHALPAVGDNLPRHIRSLFSGKIETQVEGIPSSISNSRHNRACSCHHKHILDYRVYMRHHNKHNSGLTSSSIRNIESSTPESTGIRCGGVGLTR